ncbi:hypothetical protein [Chryseobacterium phocaeense]|uniref:hypothetical protein n=1 Tax=Chryseobacterium phocaeense TaxID=1816690 RepID=UPI001117C9A5|nr:hypothetical protein [Chryseobacterium phocaeense]
MKRSYFIFYGSAMACCISMLAALQIGNLSTTSPVVNKTAVSACYSDETNCFDNSIAFHNYTKQTGDASCTTERLLPSFNKFSLKLYAGTQSRNKTYFKRYNQEINHVIFFNDAQVGNGPYHPPALMSSKLYSSVRYVKPLHLGIETDYHRKAGRYAAGDAEIREGFNFIIDFPDKTS